MTGETSALILVIDDDPDFQAIAGFFLRRHGYATQAAADWPVAADLLLTLRPAVVIIDRNLGQSDGLKLIPIIREKLSTTPVILTTAESSVDLIVQAMKAGAYDFVGKPLDEARLMASLAKAVEHHRLLSRVEALAASRANEDHFESLIGRSAQIRTVYDTIRNIAPTGVSVMISGESGTGKELAAQAIHLRSDRAKGPFVAINMAAIPAALLESVLFGHEKGAFTGADKAHPGACGEAESGTLFLDEITEMPIELQPKLLRFLQERTYRPVGARADKIADVRVLAATNRDPLLEVKNNRLRLDLYYRLNVVPVHLPALREREGDVELLAMHFLRVMNKRYDKTFEGFSSDAMEMLVGCPWPGNVRQLVNVIERAVVRNSGTTISANMLPKDLAWSLDADTSRTDADKPASTAAQVPAQPAAPAEPKEESTPVFEEAGKIIPLDELEKRAIAHALKACNGSASLAARHLGVSPATIYRKIKPG
jgi:DNA-binding NtrC family response regulator